MESSNLNSHISHLNSENRWITHLVQTIENARNEHKLVVVIAAARKMSRLLEFYIAKDAKLARLFRNDDASPIVITEHAIPFFLNGKSYRDTEVIILDDLIIFGDTVESIGENVFYLTGIKAKIIAMAASENSNLEFKWSDIVYPTKGSIDILTDKSIPAFTAKNSWDIVSLRRSIDLEHSIIKFKFESSDLYHNSSNELSYSYLRESLLKAAKDHFKDEIVYAVSHTLPENGEQVESVTIAFTGKSKRLINNDFNKIRFFIGKDCIHIVSYAPNMWGEIDLTDGELLRFNTQGLNSCWEKVKKADENIKIPKLEHVEGIWELLLKNGFELRRELSKTIFANYLMSFQNFLLFKEDLLDILKKAFGYIKCIGIDIYDLSLLMGEDLASQLFDELNNEILKEPIRPIFYFFRDEEGSLDKPLIPVDFEQSYEKDKLVAINLSSSVPIALSSIFFLLWKKFGLINNRQKEDRIRVGESFDSLYLSLSKFYHDKSLKENLYRWIDSRIDLGVVIPKYEYFIDKLGFRIWRRYFRAGEREDIFVDVSRIASVAIKKVFGNEREISIEDFITIIGPFLREANNFYPHQVDINIFDDGLMKDQSLGDSPEFHLWIFMIIIGALKLTDPLDWSKAKLNDSENNPFKTDCLPLF